MARTCLSARPPLDPLTAADPLPTWAWLKRQRPHWRCCGGPGCGSGLRRRLRRVLGGPASQPCHQPAAPCVQRSAPRRLAVAAPACSWMTSRSTTSCWLRHGQREHHIERPLGKPAFTARRFWLTVTICASPPRPISKLPCSGGDGALQDVLRADPLRPPAADVALLRSGRGIAASPDSQPGKPTRPPCAGRPPARAPRPSSSSTAWSPCGTRRDSARAGRGPPVRRPSGCHPARCRSRRWPACAARHRLRHPPDARAALRQGPIC